MDDPMVDGSVHPIVQEVYSIWKPGSFIMKDLNINMIYLFKFAAHVQFILTINIMFYGCRDRRDGTCMSINVAPALGWAREESTHRGIGL